MLQRAYSRLEVKSFDEDARIIEGIATTPEPDRMGDIIEPQGAKFLLPIPLLWQHRSDQPIGHVTHASVTKDGIAIRAKLLKIDEPGPLKTRLDEAWQSIKHQLVRALSIGFRPIGEPELIKGAFAFRFKEWEWLELSAVTIPANADASITAIKSIVQSDLAASGTGQAAVVRPSPGVTGHIVVSAKGAKSMKTIIEQIKAFEATRAAKDAERTAIMEKAGEMGETLDVTQSEKYDAIAGEIKSIDAHLVRLRDMDETNKAAAVPVNPGTAVYPSATPRVVTVKSNRPAGIGLARVAIAKIAARLEGCTVSEIIKNRWADDSELLAYVQRAAVPAGTTTNPDWAGNLVYQSNLETEFIEFLRPQTVIGRIPGLRRVPFNVRIAGQTSGALAAWVGQGKPKPVTSFATTTINLTYTKIAAIAIITEELARFSAPSAEMLVRDELARAVIERMDVDFIDPASAVSSGVNPASITNGVTPLSSAGTSADNARTDLTNLLSGFVENNVNVAGLVLVMPNTLALALSIMVNSLGQPEFPGLGINGGTLIGIPVITSQYAANQSGSGNLVIAINAPDIYLADDGNVRLDASREASIQMSDAPSQDATTGTGQSLVSMYQTNSIAIRAERYINWAKARATAVSFIDDVNWGSVGSPS